MITKQPTKRISTRSQWQTFLRVLPTRWRRKPAGIEITPLSHYGLFDDDREEKEKQSTLIVRGGHFDLQQWGSFGRGQF